MFRPTTPHFVLLEGPGKQNSSRETRLFDLEAKFVLVLWVEKLCETYYAPCHTQSQLSQDLFEFPSSGERGRTPYLGVFPLHLSIIATSSRCNLELTG
jgi:hypothetical protein